ncbi:hypothetical protein, partial [Asanoa ishikariensis]
MSQGTSGNGNGSTSGKLVEGLRDYVGALVDHAVSAVNERMGESRGDDGSRHGRESINEGSSPANAVTDDGVIRDSEVVSQDDRADDQNSEEGGQAKGEKAKNEPARDDQTVEDESPDEEPAKVATKTATEVAKETAARESA